MNLIQLQETVKGLSDAELSAQLDSPSGDVPPFVALTEVRRREEMRKRYDQQEAARKPRTTVLEDLQATRMRSMKDRRDSAAGAVNIVPGYADGGPVVSSDGTIDYGALMSQYGSSLSDYEKRKRDNFALALMAAGANMAAGKSSNFFTNVGTGINAGLTTFMDTGQQLENDRQTTLENLIRIDADRRAENQRRMEFDYQREQDAREMAQREDLATPASIRETQAYGNMTPEEQAIFDKLNPPSPSSTYSTGGLADDIRMIEDAARKQEQASIDQSLSLSDPEAYKRELENANQRALVQTYLQLRRAYAYNPGIAEQYRVRAGIPQSAINDATLSTSSDPSANIPQWSDYF